MAEIEFPDFSDLNPWGKGSNKKRQKGKVIKTFSGYEKGEVEAFKQAGDLLGTPNDSFSGPTLKEGSSTNGIGSGFQGTFSDATTEQLQSLADIFDARRQAMLQKKRQPGRSILMAEG